MNVRRIGLTALVFAACATSAAMTAQRAARPAEEWIKLLDSPARIASLKVEEIVERLALKPGQVVADLGAGTGVFSLPMARAVGPGGKMYAVDIEKGLVDYIAGKARAAAASNVLAILGQAGDPALPAADVDLAFMHDVLHHVDDRAGYLRAAAKYVKPAGRFAFVEPDATTGVHRDDPKLQVTKEQLTAWMAAIGFAPAGEFPLFTDKWFVVFARTP
jgi:ubiquinone/menaquinone biosynthesis C-methylase UbiE